MRTASRMLSLVAALLLLGCSDSGTSDPATDTITDQSQCTPQCGGKVCGPDGCGGSCGSCSGTAFCNSEGLCSGACVPDCDAKVCGSDGCGGVCGSCPQGQSCDDAGQCTSDCVGSCAGKECGDDGCGNTCGTCTGNTSCDANNQCVTDQCTPQCEGRVCGDDGCGNSCGTCPPSQTCNAATGQCGATCVPQCDGRECGDDGCGGACGTCLPTETCTLTGQCETDSCVPNCVGKVCGDNGCGGTCGNCQSNETCNAAQTACELSGCQQIIVGPDDLEVVFDGIYVTESLTPNIGGANPEQISFEFYTNDTGVFDLGSGDNANYSTCNQCVRLFEDVDPAGMSPAARQYYQSGGQITINPSTAPLEGTFTGTLTDVTLVEVTIDPSTYESTPVPGGACVSLTSPTTVSTGDGCTPDCEGKVCGPDGCGGTCGAGCAADETCNESGTACDAGPSCTSVSVTGDLEYVIPGLFVTDMVSASGGALPERLMLEFYTNDIGDIDLADATNGNYATCEQCVRLIRDYDETGEAAPAKQFFQSGGSMYIAGSTPPTGGSQLNVVLTDLTMTEVTFADDGSFISTEVPDGECLTFTTPLNLKTPACVPQCDGKICGTDGCGGSCGAGCAADETCSLDGTACTTASGCQSVTVTGPLVNIQAGVFATTGVAPALGGSEDDIFQIEFYTTDTGSFDLALGLNANYKDCDQCVRLFIDANLPDAKQFYQTAGTLEVDASTPPGSGEMNLTLTGLELTEVTIADDFTSVPVPGGACITLTTPTTLSTE